MVTAATIAACSLQLAFDGDPLIGQSILTAVSAYDCEASTDFGAVIERLRVRGQDGVADAIEAKVALTANDLDHAVAALERARDHHAPRCAMVRLALWLAPTLYDRGRRGAALRIMALGFELVGESSPDQDRELRDPLVVLQMRILAGTGQLDEALRLSDDELARTASPMHRAWVHQVRLEMLWVKGNPKQAEAEVWATIRAALVAMGFGYPQAAQLQSSALYGLADILREQRRFDEAEQALDLAHTVVSDDSVADQLYARALIHRDRGQLDRAEHGLNVALSPQGPGGPLTGDLTWSVPLELGRVRIRRGDLAGAEVAFRQAIEAIERLRANGPASSDPAVEGQMVADYRQPYEQLLGVLVDQARWDESFAVLARLDAGGLNSDRSSAASLVRGELLIVKQDVTTPWSSPWPGEPGAGVDADVLRRAWGKRDLVAVFRAGTKLCRLEVLAGTVSGDCVGEAAVLERAARRLQAVPTDRDAARLLGDALIPPGDGPLDLLLVGPIARAPLPALRNQGGLVVGQRPVRRVLGLLAKADRAAADGPPTIVGFAGRGGNATAAEQEATAVASLLGVGAVVGGAATTRVVTEARTGLLHIAGHARMVDGVPQLELADGDLTATTIGAMASAPRLVVLASCDSASARDEGNWGSLAAAFLQAGSDLVIASDRAVDDGEARALMLDFYRGRGDRDPARVLGGLQAALGEAALDSTTWAAFTVIAAPPRRPPPVR